MRVNFGFFAYFQIRVNGYPFLQQRRWGTLYDSEIRITGMAFVYKLMDSACLDKPLETACSNADVPTI